MKEDIKININNLFKSKRNNNLREFSLELYKILGFDTSRSFELDSKDYLGLQKIQANQIDVEKAIVNDWKFFDFLFQITDEECNFGKNSKSNSKLLDKKLQNKEINSYLFACLELSGEHYSRTDLSNITREINKIFMIPVMVLFSYSDNLTLGVIYRRKNKKDSIKDVLEKVTLIKDIHLSNPHRAHLDILSDLSMENFVNVSNFIEFDDKIQKILDTKELNKKFYKDLYEWYSKAVNLVHFPNDAKKDEKTYNQESVIRLLTRLIFIWFLKEKNLIPNELFDEEKLSNILKGFNKNDSNVFYKAILQNLFFATLNQNINERKFTIEGSHLENRNQYGIKTLYRYNKDFQINENEVIDLFKKVPFVNGGLFDCLDSDENDSNKILYLDGFSRNPKKQAQVPDSLFFGNIGLFQIFNKYKFTVAENTPIEEEVALDPELLGRVFEELLATYNPETGTTARKSTGSFYTPREIVNYMVDESIVAYLQDKLEGDKEKNELRIRNLIAYNDSDISFSDEEVANLIDAIDDMKVLDPACGSGAFPMGVLHKLVYVLQKLDKDNRIWFDKQMEKTPPEIREETRKSLQGKSVDYIRKLGLIESSIYGVDIQPIAIQISKLRFFISLIVEQKPNNNINDNYGIKPLPNLETKFVAANTLIGLEEDKGLKNIEVENAENQLFKIRKEIFYVNSSTKKKKLQEKEKTARQVLKNALLNCNFGNKSADKIANWDPFDQNTSANWFDPEWMFGINDGFDIVIGNPPYGAKYSEEHKKYFKEHYESAKSKEIFENKSIVKLKGSLDTFSLFIDNGLQLLKTNSILSFIVPMAITSNESLTSLHNILLNNCETIKISSYSDRPKKVFENAEQAVSIISLFYNKQKTKNILTTKVNKRYKEKPISEVINELSFVDSLDYIKYGRFPKIGQNIEVSILKKLFSIKTNLKNLIVENGRPVYYRSAGGRYYKIITNFSTNSNAEKSFNVKDHLQNIVAAILCSNLYYWFYHIYSDNFNLKTYELEIFPIPIEKLSFVQDKIESIYKLYLEDLEKNAIIQKANYSNISEMKVYYARKSKHLIDQIDLAIKDAYGLTDEEINFIINYDIKFRTDDEE